MREPIQPAAIRLLGPLEITLAGRPVPITAGRLRTLLATLAVSAGTTVGVDRLAQAVWGDRPPVNARRGLQVYVTRLRRALGRELIVTRPHGYALAVDADRVDALRLLNLLNAAAAAAGTRAERVLLVEALGLWRGRPFEDLRSDYLDRTVAPAFVERYLAAVERRIDVDLSFGSGRELAAEVAELAARYPLRESLQARWLRVLARCGRNAEALRWYAKIRVRFADELGVDPTVELQRIHVQLLRGLDAVPAAPAAPRGLPSGRSEPGRCVRSAG